MLFSMIYLFSANELSIFHFQCTYFLVSMEEQNEGNCFYSMIFFMCGGRFNDSFPDYVLSEAFFVRLWLVLVL